METIELAIDTLIERLKNKGVLAENITEKTTAKDPSSGLVKLDHSLWLLMKAKDWLSTSTILNEERWQRLAGLYLFSAVQILLIECFLPFYEYEMVMALCEHELEKMD